MTKMQDRLRAELSDLGQRREAARAEIKATSDALPTLARRARKAGLTKVEIAQLANVSRPALDSMLRE